MVWEMPRIRVYLSGVDVDPTSALYMILNVVDKIFYEYGIRLEVESVEPRPPWGIVTPAPGLGLYAGPDAEASALSSYAELSSYIEFGGRRIELQDLDEDRVFYEISGALAEILDSIEGVGEALDRGVWGRNPPPHFSAPVYLTDVDEGVSAAA